MVYRWKISSLYPVNAETAKEELNRIYEKNGKLEPAEVVKESRPESAPLHPVFEWNDTKAAELYRIDQAKHMMCAIVQVEEREEQPPQEVRVFIHAEKAYHPVDVVLRDPSMKKEALRDALRSMQSFRQKYSSLAELSRVIAEMDRVLDSCAIR